MSSSGRTDSAEPKRSVPLPVLLAGLAAVLLAMLIGTQVLPILYAVLFPPLPPIPDGLALVSHVSQDRGVDDWVYTSSQPACQLVTFYIEKGGQCQIAPECNPVPTEATTTPATRVSYCVGQQIFSGFAMRWQAAITPQFDNYSQLHLSRETFWSGVIPPLRETALP